MSLNVTFEQMPSYLAGTAIGPWNRAIYYWSLDNLKPLVDLIGQRCDQLGYERVLVDVTDVPGEAEDIDRYRIGLYIARVMPGRPRMAVIARPESINKLAEKTAVNRGAVVLATGDRNEAVKWLLDDSPPVRVAR